MLLVKKQDNKHTLRAELCTLLFSTCRYMHWLTTGLLEGLSGQRRARIGLGKGVCGCPFSQQIL